MVAWGAQLAVVSVGKEDGSLGRRPAVVCLLAAGDLTRPAVGCPGSILAWQSGLLGSLCEELLAGEAGAEPTAATGSEEAPAAGDAPTAQHQGRRRPPRQLLLPIGGEWHEALRQLVACLKGEAHAGELEWRLLLQVSLHGMHHGWCEFRLCSTHQQPLLGLLTACLHPPLSACSCSSWRTIQLAEECRAAQQQLLALHALLSKAQREARLSQRVAEAERRQAAKRPRAGALGIADGDIVIYATEGQRFDPTRWASYYNGL